MDEFRGRRVWENLSLYESIKLVETLYSKRHAKQLKADKAQEIVAYFAQGHEYFRSAVGAGELVRPLLLYYGCMSLARGLILFSNPSMRMTSLGSKHGLQTKGWEALNRTVKKVPDLQVEVLSRGTMPELLEVTGNAETNRIPADVTPNSIPAVYQGTCPVRAGTQLTVKNILSQIPDLAEMFESTFGEHSNCLRGDVLAINSFNKDGYGSARICIFESSRGVPDQRWVANMLGREYIAERPVEDFHIFAQDPGNQGVKNFWFPLPYKRLGQKEPERDTALGLPVIISKRSGATFTRLPTPDGISLTILPALHLIAYVTGMLVRYYPGYWMAVVNRATGDSIAPILSAASSTIEEQYPHLILERLRAMPLNSA